MSAFSRGLIVAMLHVLIVSSLGAKLLYDRETLPRVWVRTAPYDPNLPIRGRYVRIRLEMEARGDFPLALQREGAQRPLRAATHRSDLVLENDRLVAVPNRHGRHGLVGLRQDNGKRIAVLQTPLAFFIAEHVADPSRRSDGEELWAEVTLPKKGPPRPIRLAVKREGKLVPLDLR